MSVYTGLTDGQIRTLRIEPWSEATQEVRCELSVASLSDQPEYFALSYTWGLPSPGYRYDEVFLATHAPLLIGQQIQDDAAGNEAEPPQTDNTILCNGTRVQVARNLYDFLRHCSKHPDAALRGPLWVDALSIDQSNLPERSHQVHQMAEIYKAASHVVVWLGRESPLTTYAVDLITALASASTEERRLQAHPSMLSSDRTHKLSDLRNWIALAEFYERTWFSRAWIIQEVTFARQLTVLCGSHIISWKDLTDVSHFLATSVWTNYFKDPTKLGTGNNTSPRWHNMPARLAATRKTWHSDSKDGLLYALIRARKSNCQDPRDKVYSQLRLGNADIFPSYKVSVAEVYIRAAKYILENTDNLLLLTAVEGPNFQTLPNLPSWVPDWSVTRVLGLGVTGYYSFNAAGSEARTFSTKEDAKKHILSVKAVRVASIADAAETKEEIEDFSKPTRLWTMLAELEETYMTGESREEVLWRTLMTNRSNESHSVQVQYPAAKANLHASFQAWVEWQYLVASKKCSQCSYPVRTTSDSILPTPERIAEIIEQSNQNPGFDAVLANSAALFQTHYSHAMLLRPFRTGNRLLGLGSQSLRKDDSVWLVPGCRVPLVFRSVEGTTEYRLIGGAYVHGIMDGQLLEKGKLDFEMVDLI